MALGVSDIQAVSYSPPAWMTVSGDNTGAFTYGADNLARANFAPFSAYLRDVVVAYKSLYGITFSSISPTNEPLEGWWVSGNNQEGCNLGPSSVAALLSVVRDTFASAGLKTPIAAVGSYEPVSATALVGHAVMDTVSVHGYTHDTSQSYDSASSDRIALAGLARRMGKRVAMSEWGPQNTVTSLLQTALVMAAHISLDVNILEVVSWSYWQAVEMMNGQWGLVMARYELAYNGGSYNGPFVYTITKSYYVMMQYSRWITPGMWPIRINHGCQMGVVAAYNARLKRLVIVIQSQQNHPTTITLRLKGFKCKRRRKHTCTVASFRTSLSENHVALDTSRLKLPGNFVVKVPPLSVTTWVISGMRVPPTFCTPSNPSRCPPPPPPSSPLPSQKPKFYPAPRGDFPNKP